MPLPKTKDVGKVMRFLKKDKPGMPQRQKIAIALNQTGKGNKAKALTKKSKTKKKSSQKTEKKAWFYNR